MPGAFIVRGDDGEEYGPVSLEELREWVRENRAGLGTTVRADEPNSLWQPWQYYPELVALLAEIRATTLGPGVVLAPLPQRMVALIVDLILAYIMAIPLWAISLVAFPSQFIQQQIIWGQTVLSSGVMSTPPPLPLWAQWLTEAIIYGTLILYMAGFHAAHGRTPAKSILKLQVVNEHGQKPTIPQALLRGLVLSLSVAMYGLPLLVAFIHPQRRALHDLAAGTYVVEK